MGGDIDTFFKNCKKNIQEVGAWIIIIAWILCTVASSLYWSQDDTFRSNVGDYTWALIFLIPFINLMAFLQEVPILHFLALGMIYVIYPTLCVIDGLSDKIKAAYILALIGMPLSLLGNHEGIHKVKNFSADKLQSPLVLLGLLAFILIYVGCILLFAHSQRKQFLSLSVPAFWYGTLWLIQLLLGILGLDYVLVFLAGQLVIATLDDAMTDFYFLTDRSLYQAGLSLIYAGVVFVVLVEAVNYFKSGKKDGYQEIE